MIRLTVHAREAMQARRLSLSWVAEALDQPTATQADTRDASLVHALRPIAEAGGKILRVVYRHDASDIVVITAFFRSLSEALISTSYDPDADALYVRFNDPAVEISDTREIEPGVLLDVDANGRLVGLEILGVRARSSATAQAA